MADQSGPIVKQAFVIFCIAGALAACGFLEPREEVRQEPGRTTYRAPEGSSVESPDMTPAPEKVPGESR